MRRFFASWRELTGRPLVAKCNRLNAAAHRVAEALPEATFICVEREPAWHCSVAAASPQDDQRRG